MLSYPDTLISNNIDAFGIIKALDIQGHRSVQTLNDLYTLTDPQLSLSGNNTNNDSLGSEWFVVSEKTRYELIDWSKRKTAAGWKKVVGDTYTKSELDKKFSDLKNNMTWKPSVENFAAIATTYPTPKEGWTVSTADDNNIYRYDETSKKWINIFQNQTALASAQNNGLLSKELWVKLNGLSQYVHPTNHPATMITQDENHRFITDDERKKWNALKNFDVSMITALSATVITQDKNHRFITDDERKKWNSLVTNPLLPTNIPASNIVTDNNNRFVTDVEKNKWNDLVSFPGYNAIGGIYGTSTKAARYDHNHEYLSAVYDNNNLNVKDKLFDNNKSTLFGLKLSHKGPDIISQRIGDSRFDCIITNSFPYFSAGNANYLLLSRVTGGGILHGTIKNSNEVEWTEPKKLAYFEDTLSNHIKFDEDWNKIFNNNAPQSKKENYTKFGDYNNLKFLGGSIENNVSNGNRYYAGFDIRDINAKHVQLAIDMSDGNLLTRGTNGTWCTFLRREENKPFIIRNSGRLPDVWGGLSSILNTFGVTENKCNLQLGDMSTTDIKTLFFTGYTDSALISYLPQTEQKDSYFTVSDTGETSKLVIGIGDNSDDEIWFKTPDNDLRIFRNNYGHKLVDTYNFRSLFVDEVLYNKSGHAEYNDGFFTNELKKYLRSIGFINKNNLNSDIPNGDSVVSDNALVLCSLGNDGTFNNGIFGNRLINFYEYFKKKFVSENLNKNNTTVTLTGDVTGTASGNDNLSINTSIPNGKITNQMLAGNITKDKLVDKKIKIAGTDIEIGEEFTKKQLLSATNGMIVYTSAKTMSEHVVTEENFNSVIVLDQKDDNYKTFAELFPNKKITIKGFDSEFVKKNLPVKLRFLIKTSPNLPENQFICFGIKEKYYIRNYNKSSYIKEFEANSIYYIEVICFPTYDSSFEYEYGIINITCYSKNGKNFNSSNDTIFLQRDISNNTSDIEKLKRIISYLDLSNVPSHLINGFLPR